MKRILSLTLTLLLLPLIAQEEDTRVLYEKAMSRLETERDLALLRLGTQYRGALERGMQRAVQAGNLDLLTAFDAENKRFQDNPGIPEPLSEPEPLVLIQQTYLQQEIQIRRTYFTGTLNAAAEWDRQLQLQEKELVQGGEVEKAMALREERKSFSGSEALEEARSYLSSHELPQQGQSIRVPVRLQEPTFLSEMPLVGKKKGHGDIGLNGKRGWGRARRDVTRSQGKKVEHGVSIHPPKEGNAYADFELGGKYSQLSGKVALNANANKMIGETVFFRIYSDGKKIWESEAFQKGSEPQEFKVQLPGTQVLRLETYCPGVHHAAHALFIDPVLR